jgi:cytochrome c oxidase subunit 2
VRILWVVLFGLVPIAGLATFVVAYVKNAWLPENQSEIGKDIDFLFYVILGITGFFFLVTEVLLAYAMLTGRAKADGKGSFFHGSTKLEVGWTLVTAGILLFLGLYQIPAWARAKFATHMPKRPVDCLVTASQFRWDVRYPTWDDQAGKPRELNTANPNLHESFELANEMHVAVGETLTHLTTRDVIHSFWIPNLRVKQDALPGHMIPVWFDAQRPGETYEWVCAELCGWGHYTMRAKVIVHTKEDYDAWLKKMTENFRKGEALQGPVAKKNDQ